MGDISFAFRMFRKNPGFAATAVLCLALGIGVNAAIFSALNYALLSPLAVPGSSRVVEMTRGTDALFSYPDYKDFRDRNRSFAGLAASNITESSLDAAGSSALAAAETVSGNYGEVMGVRPMLGRWFAAGEERSSAGLAPAVISYGAWQRLFGGDPGALGKQVRSESRWCIVVGVAPREFTGALKPWTTDIWVPLEAWAQQYPNMAAGLRDRKNLRVLMFGRLRPGATVEQATAEMNTLDQQLRTEYRRDMARAVPITARLARGVAFPKDRLKSGPVMALLMGVVGLVLLIACVNVGNLLLARAMGRRREVSIRLALGATRRRIIAQCLTESLLLALTGGALGLMFGYWTCRFLESLAPGVLRPNLALDGRVLAFTLAVSFVASVVFGLAPALRSARVDVLGALKGDTPVHQSGGRFHLRQVPVVAQVAVSLSLMIAAGLFLRALKSTSETDPGFAVDHRLAAQVYISPPEYTPETGRVFYRTALDRVRGLAGVRSASLTYLLPLTEQMSQCAATENGSSWIQARDSIIDAGYLATMRIELVAGRDFSAADRPSRPAVRIVNESLAGRLWPGQNPVGQRLRVGAGCEQGRGTLAEVVGVAKDSRNKSLGEPPAPQVYRPFSQNYVGLATLVVETAGDPALMAAPLRQALLELDRSLRIYDVRTLGNIVAESYWQVRWEASALGAFGILALGLAAVGLYGVVAYNVAQRTREIGVRMAIGARPSDVFRLVIGQGMALTCAGVALGLALAFALTRFFASMLYGLSPTDGVTFTGAALVWIAIAMLASYLPARRAAKVDPIVALRYE
jgi:predicted permease